MALRDKGVVRLGPDQRHHLDRLVSSGEHPARVLTRARILLKTDAGAAALAGLPRLERVGLESSQVADAGAAALGQSPALAEVNLAWARVTAAGAVALAEGCGPRLVRLRLVEVRLADAEVGRLARACPNLLELDLYKCHGVTDGCVPALAALRDLRRFPHGVGGISRRGYAALAEKLPACDDLPGLASLAGD